MARQRPTPRAAADNDDVVFRTHASLLVVFLNHPHTEIPKKRGSTVGCLVQGSCTHHGRCARVIVCRFATVVRWFTAPLLISLGNRILAPLNSHSYGTLVLLTARIAGHPTSSRSASQPPQGEASFSVGSV